MNDSSASKIPRLVYVQDCIFGEASKLYVLNLETGETDSIGSIADNVYDIAVVDSRLYGIKHEEKTSKLIKIDTATGKAETIGDIGFQVAGMAYNSQRKTLYAAAAKQLIAIALDTGKGTPVVTVSKDKRGCGEVAFDSNGKAYITLIGTNKKKQLASCDLDTGRVKIIGNIGFSDLASMEFVGDILYGVTGNFFNLGQDGRIIRIDTKTGRGKVVTKTNPLERWAGMTQFVPVTVKTSLAKTTQTEIFPTKTIVKTSTQTQSTTEENMQLLTIDTKENCYVIDPNGMNELQQNVASKFTLEKGNYEIKIVSGNYSYAQSQQAEPFVLLWIYGSDGSTFINKETAVETGATWTTLNGYQQTLQLEVKENAVLCGLFFDLNNKSNSGSIQLAIKSNDDEPQQITVDSQQNCYVLDEKYLASLKKWGNNFIELEPGNYRVKIREGNASYWSDKKKFKLEPWALIWIKAGSFVPQLTGVEVSETWCSLNGLQDEFILEVKSKTTLSGLFFDTFKDDNEGQIVIEIATVSAEEIAKKHSQQQNKVSSQQKVITSNSGQKTVNISNKETQTVTSSSSNSSSKETQTVGSRGFSSVSGSSSYTFRFDEAQMEQMWQEMAAKIETSVAVQDEQDEKKEAYYWDNLEKWILKGYQTQAKELAMQVARLEFMMKSITQQMEVSFNQNFQAWSGYFDNRLNELIDTRMTEMVEEQVNLKISDRTTEIRDRVIQQLQSDIDRRVESVVNLKISDRSTEIKNQVVEQLQGDMENRINTVVNLKVDDRAEKINTQVVESLQNEMDKRINNIVNIKVENQAQDINTKVIQQLQSDMDKRIDAVVNLKITDRVPNIKNLVTQQLQADVDKRIDSVVNLKLGDQTLDITNSITKQLQGDMDKRIDTAVELKIDNQSQNVKNSVVQQLQAELEKRINTAVENKTDNSVQLVVNNVINNVDDRIDVKLENKILNFRDDVTSIVKNELNQNYTDSLKTTVLSDIKKQQFFIDMDSIKAEVSNFYSRLGQFENQLYLRIEQGDTQLYNWTLEQLTALQGCLSDRQTLSEMFESFASKLKDELDNAPCVQPSRFTPMTATVGRDRISPARPNQLPGS